MNTESDSKNSDKRAKTREKLHNLAGSESDSSSTEEALVVTQKELEDERDSRREERFYWIAAIMVIVDLWIFPQMETWSAPISIAFIQFLILLSLGNYLGADIIYTLTQRVIDKWNGAFKGNG